MLRDNINKDLKGLVYLREENIFQKAKQSKDVLTPV